MKLQDIKALIEAIDASSITNFTFEEDGTKIKMKKVDGKVVQVEQPIVQQSVAPVAQAPVEVVAQQAPAEKEVPVQEVVEEEEVDLSSFETVVSPMVGTFYAAPSPDADPYVKKGDVVDASTVVCIVEAMKLFNEIEAEVSGEIVDILVEDGELVEFDQPLFLVKPN